jgi:hypothetical protein
MPRETAAQDIPHGRLTLPLEYVPKNRRLDISRKSLDSCLGNYVSRNVHYEIVRAFDVNRRHVRLIHTHADWSRRLPSIRLTCLHFSSSSCLSFLGTSSLSTSLFAILGRFRLLRRWRYYHHRASYVLEEPNQVKSFFGWTHDVKSQTNRS